MNGNSHAFNPSAGIPHCVECGEPMAKVAESIEGEEGAAYARSHGLPVMAEHRVTYRCGNGHLATWAVPLRQDADYAHGWWCGRGECDDRDTRHDGRASGS